VNDNRSLGQTQRTVRRLYEGSGLDPDPMWQFTEVDLAAAAESLGAAGILVNRPGELGEALRTAFAAERPVVIDVKTDPGCMAPLPWG
jgi:acetolactate synthase-1/2/3 large subunit